MSKVKHGDTIAINYTEKFEDGTVFGSSEVKNPLEFTVIFEPQLMEIK